ncbi:hypothetical protein EIK77_005217 [Talaromyces pinophilus]|nr:hypothetical protein EIK77_005217 [Talaromyces pinophilus]
MLLHAQLAWLAAPGILQLALLAVPTCADNYSTTPLLLDLINVTLSDGVAENRDIGILLGGQPEGLRITFTLNNTRVRNAYDCNITGNATAQAQCLGASGGTYDLTRNTFNETGGFNVSHIDTPPVGATVRRGTDQAQFGNLTFPAFPFEVWSAIAFGPQSSVLQRIIDSNTAPSRFLGLFFGSRFESQPQDGELVIGGYNIARVNGSYHRVRVSQIYPPGHQPYIGNLTIVLEGGYTTFIPNYELLSDERGTNSIGKYDVISNNVMAAVGTAPTDYGNDIPILGGVNLSQNYLFVDYDHGFFGLAPVVSDPMIVGKRNIRTVFSSPPPQNSPGGTNHVAVIVGSVVGGVVGITLVVLVVWRGRRSANYFIRRRSPSCSGQSQEVAPPYPEVTGRQMQVAVFVTKTIV